MWCILAVFCFQNAEFELHASQTQLDHANNKGLQLLEELRKIPNFNVHLMEQDLDDINLKWETSSKVSSHAATRIMQEMVYCRKFTSIDRVLQRSG